MNKIKEIINNLNTFVIPHNVYECPLNEAEKANFFYLLTASELSQKKQEIQQEHAVVLKKVKVFANYEGDAAFQSFQFQAQSAPPPEMQLKMNFNTLEELQELLKYTQKDEIGAQDEKVILSLNIMIQNSDSKALMRFFIRSLHLDAMAQNHKRYSYYLEKYCSLLAQIINRIVADADYIQLVQDLIDALPSIQQPVFQFLKTICDHATTNFDPFFNIFKNLVSLMILNEYPERLNAIKYFITINTPEVLNLLKTKNIKAKITDPFIWEVLQQEALSKIKTLGKVTDRESSLLFVFYMGSKQCEMKQQNLDIIPTLLANAPNECQEFIIQKLKQMISLEITKPIFKMISKAIPEWRAIPQPVLTIFVEFSLTNESVENVKRMFQAYLEGGTNQELLKQVEEKVFANPDSMQCYAEKTSIDLLQQQINGVGIDLISHLSNDNEKILAKTLFKRFLHERDWVLKENEFRLLKLFLSHLKDYIHTKDILDDLFQQIQPSGLIMALIWNCINPQKGILMEDQIKKILSKPQYLNSDQIVKGLAKYRASYPEQYLQIVETLDESTKYKLVQMRLI